MIVLRTQLNHSFDREFVFTALHKRFTFVHLFYSHLTCLIKPFPFRSIPSNHLPSTKGRFVGSACTAPTEGPPPSYLQHWSPSLFELINGLGFHSGHTITANVVIVSGVSRRVCHDHNVLHAGYLLICGSFFIYLFHCGIACSSLSPAGTRTAVCWKVFWHEFHSFTFDASSIIYLILGP